MKRSLLLLVLVAGALAVPGTAQARIVQLGTTADPVRSKCPGDPCEVLARTTGYQGRAGAVRNPYRVPRAGFIVAFSVTLAPLQDNQISFFNDTFGAPAQVRLSILRRGKRRRTRLNHRLMAQSKLFRVDQYIGSQNPTTPGFVLDQPLRVRHNYIVALTTPTWAPAFVGGISNTNWWRSSRRKGRCSARYVTQRSAQQHLRGIRRYGCTYKGARIMYTATYVPDPKPVKR
jgi:hypothetical protein